MKKNLFFVIFSVLIGSGTSFASNECKWFYDDDGHPVCMCVATIGMQMSDDSQAYKENNSKEEEKRSSQYEDGNKHEPHLFDEVIVYGKPKKEDSK